MNTKPSTFTEFAQQVFQQYHEFLQSPEYTGAPVDETIQLAAPLEPVAPQHIRALASLLAVGVQQADPSSQVGGTYSSEDALPGYLVPEDYSGYTICSAAYSFIDVVEQIAGDKTE
jgi:hypothetical protein